MKHYILRRDGVVHPYFFKDEKKFEEKYEFDHKERRTVKVSEWVPFYKRKGKYVRGYRRYVTKTISIDVYRRKARKYYYCFVKGFNTGAGRSRKWHWIETSVDVWCEFVVEVPEGEAIEVWEQKNLPSDKTMIAKIEDFLGGHKLHSWILSLKQVKHVWGVEREEKPNEPVTWPGGEVSAWTMPDYERKLIDKEKIDLA